MIYDLFFGVIGGLRVSDLSECSDILNFQFSIKYSLYSPAPRVTVVVAPV